jgi:hypothetical protein
MKNVDLGHRIRVARVLALTATLCAVFLAVSAGSAFARSPWWMVSSRPFPQVLPENGEATIDVTAVNMGDAATTGPVTISDQLPAGVTVESVDFRPYPFFQAENNLGFVLCKKTSQTVSCTYPTESFPPEEHLPEISLHIHPYENLEVRIKVKVEAGAASGVSHVSVTGGEAEEATLDSKLEIGTQPAAFGVEDFEMRPEEEGGGIDTQAGSHPFQLSTTASFNQAANPFMPPALLRNLDVQLPPGLIGNAVALPKCDELDFRNLHEGGTVNFCPSDSAVGVAVVTIDEPIHGGLKTLAIPVFNLVPAHGEPARFGFEYIGSPVLLDTAVRSGSDYGVTVKVSNTTEVANVIASTVAIWGVPGDPAHDEARGWGCLANGIWTPKTGIVCESSKESHPIPFLSLPTACSLPFSSSIENVVSWPTREAAAGVTAPGKGYSLKDEFGRGLGITGCNRPPFDPSLEAAPEVQSGSTPSGVSVRVRMPQEANETSTGLSSSAIKDAVVTLPQGFGLNGAAAGGLEACSEGEIGFTSISNGTDLFTPALPSPFCPPASKIGSVTLRSPVIAHPLTGSVYLAAQNANPFGSLIAMYIVAEDPESGVLVKLAGEVQLSETGQITTVLRNSPQAPVEEADFVFFGGNRSALATPSKCGSYTTTASFVPWSETAAVNTSSTFNITSGPHGTPCTAQSPFAPALKGGSGDPDGGAYTPFTTSITREDGNQQVQTVQLHTPPGFGGIIPNTTPCGEAEANAGTCGPASLLGHTSVSVGVGNEPFTVTGGQVFLTGPYEGAPFGLSIVVPAKAGPFDLGLVVVRARLDVDPHTAQVTVTTDNTGPHAIPHFLKGVPVEVRRIDVSIDRSGFAFNPTNCDSLSISGTITGDEGASAAVSTPFEAVNCAKLKFAPKFSASVAGKASKANGASLDVKVGYPTGPEGTYANIKAVKVDLPKQLPSRLTTLQKACLAATFEANPASCPKASNVGTATATTPVLKVPLMGPAYIVSHGGEAFPDLEIVLQGENVTLVLVGNTQIKNGITSSTFKTVPDAPVSSFELKLPTGPFSILGANVPQSKKYNLCGQSLPMPTQITAQNGAVVKQTTRIAITGCPKSKTAKTKKKATGKRKGAGKKAKK